MSDKKKNTKKAAPKKTASVKKVEPVYRSFLYLMPEDTSAAAICEKLDFLPEDALEVWTELNIVEITVENRTITLESLIEELYDEDLELLEKLSMKQLYTCEYAEEDRELMVKIMQTLTENFDGKFGSDTEDFEPFLSLAEI